MFVHIRFISNFPCYGTIWKVWHHVSSPLYTVSRVPKEKKKSSETTTVVLSHESLHDSDVI